MSHKLAKYQYSLRHIVALVDDLKHQAAKLSAVVDGDTKEALEETLPVLDELSRLKTLLGQELADIYWTRECAIQSLDTEDCSVSFL
jgi:hypothetical protein